MNEVVVTAEIDQLASAAAPIAATLRSSSEAALLQIFVITDLLSASPLIYVDQAD